LSSALTPPLRLPTEASADAKLITRPTAPLSLKKKFRFSSSPGRAVPVNIATASSATEAPPTASVSRVRISLGHVS